MTTVSDLVAELNKFDQSLVVNGAETLTVTVTSQAFVLAPPVIVAEETSA